MDESMKLFGCCLTVFDLKQNWNKIRKKRQRRIETENIEIQFQLLNELSDWFSVEWLLRMSEKSKNIKNVNFKKKRLIRNVTFGKRNH